MNKNNLWWSILIIIIILGAYFSVVNRDTSAGNSSNFPEVSASQPVKATSTAPLIRVIPSAKK